MHEAAASIYLHVLKTQVRGRAKGYGCGTYADNPESLRKSISCLGGRASGRLGVPISDVSLFRTVVAQGSAAPFASA